MRALLLDGSTLLDNEGRLFDGACEALAQVHGLTDGTGQAVQLAVLIGPTVEPVSTLLQQTGLLDRFSPAERSVTLSMVEEPFTPDPAVFRIALDKISPEIDFDHVIFVSTNADHVDAARRLGMAAVRLRRYDSEPADITTLADLAPLVHRLTRFSGCCSKHHRHSEKKRSEATESASVDPEITTRIGQVDGARMVTMLDHVSAFPTRWSHSPVIGQVAAFLHTQFQDLGYAGQNGPRLVPFAMPAGGVQQNVLCGPETLATGFVLLCAHYDSISEDPATLAPGADDNASGIAVLLEIARLLKDVPLQRGVCYAAFGGEEQGLFGSQSCAKTASLEAWPIELVINLDMIAFQQPGREGRVVVEYDHGNKNAANDAESKAFGLVMAQAAADYTSLSIEHGDIYQSDYMPFEELGYSCIGVYEGGDNPHYHKTTDTVDKIDPLHLVEIAKMVLATILTVCR